MRERRRANQAIKRLQRRNVALKASLAAANAELREIKLSGKAGRKQTTLTPKAGLSIALRRNILNAPCDAMGLLEKSDSSRWTIARWEATLDSCLRAACRAAYKEGSNWMTELGGFAVHSVMTDATNARLWHQKKVMVGEYCSMYIVKPDVDSTKPEWRTWETFFF